MVIKKSLIRIIIYLCINISPITAKVNTSFQTAKPADKYRSIRFSGVAGKAGLVVACMPAYSFYLEHPGKANGQKKSLVDGLDEQPTTANNIIKIIKIRILPVFRNLYFVYFILLVSFFGDVRLFMVSISSSMKTMCFLIFSFSLFRSVSFFLRIS